LQFITQYPLFILFYSIFSNPQFHKTADYLAEKSHFTMKKKKINPKKIIYLFIYWGANSKTLPPIKKTSL
jgi:glutathionyl-hydroquinone reductase